MRFCRMSPPPGPHAYRLPFPYLAPPAGSRITTLYFCSTDGTQTSSRIFVFASARERDRIARPRTRVRFRIRKRHRQLERVAIDAAEALFELHIFGVRMAVSVEPGSIVEAGRAHDEGIVLPFA